MSDWPSAILFDFDGVIVNSEPLHLRAFQDVLRAENIVLTEREYYAELIGFDDRGAFAHILKKHTRATDTAAIGRLIERKTACMHEIIRAGEAPAMPGAVEFVRGLRDYPLAICSGALRSEIEEMLDGVKLREHFPIIVAAEDVAVGKPDPSGYLLAARLVSESIGRKIAPGDALIIEDAPTVIASARGVGFKALGVSTTYPAEALMHADFVVASLRPSEVVAKIPGLKIR